MAITRFLEYRIVLSGSRVDIPAAPTGPPPMGYELLIKETTKPGENHPRTFQIQGYEIASELRREAPEGSRAASWEAPFIEEESARLIQLLSEVSIPLTTGPPMMGCDGTWVTFILEGENSRIQTRYWVHPPQGWEGVAAIVEHLGAVRERALATTTSLRFYKADEIPPAQEQPASRRPWWQFRG
jgi:hypothetical protein